MPRPIVLVSFACSLALVPLQGGDLELGLMVDHQVGSSVGVDGTGRFDALKPNGFGIRLGMDVLDLWAARFGVTATYHPRSRASLLLDGADTGLRYGAEYLAVGAQLDWTLPVNLHAGVDLRRERLTLDLGGSGDTILTRPWLIAGVGYAFPAPAVQPFIRLEFSFALTRPDTRLVVTSSADEVRKGLAPRYQLSLYAGIRF